MNNGKYKTAEYIKKQADKTDRLFGKLKEHTLTCKICEKNYIWEGRKKTKTYERKVEKSYCSRSCANKVGARILNEGRGYKNYRTIAFKHYDRECKICGFNKVVVVHHINENHNDNRPENLAVLCPNHHEMFHSKYRDEVSHLI
jgi:predicted restriction endonuclease